MLDIDRLGSDINRIDGLLRLAQEGPDDEREHRYGEAADAARRAFEHLLGDPGLDAALLEAADSAARLHESASVVLALRSALKAFQAAEFRLLVDHGLDPETARALVYENGDIRDALAGEAATADRLRAALEALGDELAQALETRATVATRRRRLSLLRRAVTGLGGAFMIGADELVGAGLALSTGGLSLAGAQVSAALGTILMTKAADRPAPPPGPANDSGPNRGRSAETETNLATIKRLARERKVKLRPTWEAVLLRYQTPRELHTRARRKPFRVQAIGGHLVVTAGTGRPRRIAQGEWEHSLPLVGQAGRGPLQQTTFNSSYIEAIVDDLRGT